MRESVEPKRVLTHLRERLPEMTALLAPLVRIESPSDDPRAQRPAFELLADALHRASFASRWLPGRRTGGALYARPCVRRRGAPLQLLLGHCDTVWPRGTLEQMPVVVRDGCLYGPGAYDMKAGLVQMVFALRALSELRLQPTVTPVVLVNSDEEIGSRETLRQIRRLARRAERTLVLEPSLGPEGRLKTARKGVGRYTVTITGSAAHAGLDPGRGASAIVELSHVIQRLHTLNDIERGVSVNVGMIEGGVRANVSGSNESCGHVAIIELGASPLEPYNGTAARELLAGVTRSTVLAASDAYAARGLIDAAGMRPDLICGPAANTRAGIVFAEQICGVKTLNLSNAADYEELDWFLEEHLAG